jgi:hypothetical protein
VFRCCFTGPTFVTFQAMTVGLIAATRRRTVCGMLVGAGLERSWHHARAHRFFATARWSADAVGLVLSDLIVDRLLPQGSSVTVVVDDTVFQRYGRTVFAGFCHHDGAAKGPEPIGFGNCWVVAGIVVQVPFLTPPAVPAGARAAVASPAHREDRLRPPDGRSDRRAPSRPRRARRRGRGPASGNTCAAWTRGSPGRLG